MEPASASFRCSSSRGSRGSSGGSWASTTRRSCSITSLNPAANSASGVSKEWLRDKNTKISVSARSVGEAMKVMVVTSPALVSPCSDQVRPPLAEITDLRSCRVKGMCSV